MKLMLEENHEFAGIMNCEIMKCEDLLYYLLYPKSQHCTDIFNISRYVSWVALLDMTNLLLVKQYSTTFGKCPRG